MVSTRSLASLVDSHVVRDIKSRRTEIPRHPDASRASRRVRRRRRGRRGRRRCHGIGRVPLAHAEGREREPPATDRALRARGPLLRRAERKDLCGNQIYGAFVATPARWRGDAESSPPDRASAATSSPRTDSVKNYRVHPTHWLISTQARTTIWRLLLCSVYRAVGLRRSVARGARAAGARAAPRGVTGRFEPAVRNIGSRRGSLLSRRNGALPYSTGDFKWVVNCLLVCFTDAKTWSRSADTRTGRGARSRAPSLYPAPEHHSRFRWRIGERS